jgi:mono/diheme cytochrome c family protein
MRSLWGRAMTRVTISGFLLASGVCLLNAAPPAQTPPASVTVEATPYDMKKIVQPPKLSASEVEGRRLVVQRCAYCHDQAGPSAPWLDGERIKALGEASYREKIMKGSRRMPGWQYALSVEQLDQIMAYLKTVTPADKPVRGGRAGAE